MRKAVFATRKLALTPHPHPSPQGEGLKLQLQPSHQPVKGHDQVLLLGDKGTLEAKQKGGDEGSTLHHALRQQLSSRNHLILRLRIPLQNFLFHYLPDLRV